MENALVVLMGLYVAWEAAWGALESARSVKARRAARDREARAYRKLAKYAHQTGQELPEKAEVR